MAHPPSLHIINARDHWEWTSLHHAARTGRVDNIKLLIDKKVELDAVSDGGNTALHLAAANGKMDARKTLLKKRARNDLLNKDGSTEFELLKKFEEWRRLISNLS
jgi:ankyrin repeat protein